MERTEDSSYFCPTCGAAYLAGGGFCPADGSSLQARADDPLLGAVLDGRYRIQAPLGRGGMGRVYRALDVLDREVALKVLHGDVARDKRMAERFRREAKLAASLAHPNVVITRDFGRTEAGLLYLAMEYLEGEPLDRVLARAG